MSRRVEDLRKMKETDIRFTQLSGLEYAKQTSV